MIEANAERKDRGGRGRAWDPRGGCESGSIRREGARVKFSDKLFGERHALLKKAKIKTELRSSHDFPLSFSMNACQLGASKFGGSARRSSAATKMAAHVERDVQAWPAEGAIERLERLDRLDLQDRRDREEARERQEAARSAAVAAAALHAQGAPDRMVAAGAALLKELVGMGQGHLVDGWQPGEDEEDKRRLFLQLHALDASITGGLVGYVRRAATLLKES